MGRRLGALLRPWLWAFGLLPFRSTPAQAATDGFVPGSVPAITEKWRWHHLEALDGVTAYCGTADETGVLWLGSTAGVFSYDGREVRHFPYPGGDSPAVSNRLVATGRGEILCRTADGIRLLRDGRWHALLESPAEAWDRQNCFARIDANTMAIATRSGLYFYRSEDARLEAIRSTPAQNVLFDRRGRLWLTALDGTRVYCIEVRDGRLVDGVPWREFALRGEGDSRLISREMANGEIWFVSVNRRQQSQRYLPATESWEPLQLDPMDGANPIVDLTETADGSLLLQTPRSLRVKHRERWATLEFPDYPVPVERPFIVTQPGGHVVIGGARGESFRVDCSDAQWQTRPGLNFQCEGRDGHLWFLSVEGDVVEWDPARDRWSRHRQALPDTVVVLLATRDGTLWAAGSDRGRSAVAYRQNGVWRLDTFPQLGSMISNLSAFEDSAGRVYFGEGSQRPLATRAAGGLVEYRPAAGGGYEVRHLAPPRVPPRIVGIAEAQGRLWVGGPLLANFDPAAGAPAHLQPGFGGRWTDHVLGTAAGDLWAVQWGVGLQRFQDGGWTLYTARDGLASNQVVFVMEDRTRPGGVWAATQNGVSCFDGVSWSPLRLDESLRLNRESGALHQTRDGAVWINWSYRRWFFRSRRSAPEGAADAEQFRTIRYRPDRHAPSGRIVDYESRAEEPANLYFRFVGRDPWSQTPAAKLEYSHRLNEGPWSVFSSKNDVLLLGVAVGHHRLEMRVRDQDGNLSAVPAAATFVVVPPLWKQPWFLVSLGVMVLTVLGLAAFIVVQRVRHLVALEEFKLQFFTNLSHELRTPLTAILGPLNSLLSRSTDARDRVFLELATRNAEKMLRVVEQLLDFRRAAASQAKVYPGYGDIVAFVRQEVDLSRPLADGKSQSLSFRTGAETHHCWFDSGRLEKIVGNLVSNAIKYTPPGGSVLVKLRIRPESEGGAWRAELTVTDNGKGIAVAHQRSIFEPFVRVGEGDAGRAPGTGLGLALTRQLVADWGGRIAVESPPVHSEFGAVGSRFHVELPLRSVPPRGTPVTDAPAVAIAPAEAMAEESRKETLLLVDDSPDLLAFFQTELAQDYEILTANDGRAGLERAQQEMPTVVITDVMMPVMDGLTLCARLKTTEATSHIPVIIVTALKAAPHEMRGLANGADDYISKPIRIDHVRQKLHNLSATRRRWQESFRRQLVGESFDPAEASTNPVDQKFLERSLRFVEEQLDSETLDVEQMAAHFGMSRVTLYRKIKALAGLPPNAFIRAVRLRRAAELLRTGKFQVQEVVGLVGFQEPSYFGVCFRKQFGCTPSDYRARFSRGEPSAV